GSVPGDLPGCPESTDPGKPAQTASGSPGYASPASPAGPAFPALPERSEGHRQAEHGDTSTAITGAICHYVYGFRNGWPAKPPPVLQDALSLPSYHRPTNCLRYSSNSYRAGPRSPQRFISCRQWVKRGVKNCTTL